MRTLELKKQIFADQKRNTILKQNAISHGLLTSILHYDEAKGIFVWKVNWSNKAKAGSIAGVANKNGYHYIGIRINGRRNQYLVHRLAWFYVYGRWPEEVLDHINGNPRDNRISNLREATRSQNSQSKRVSVKLGSGLRGVNICPRTGRWRARVQIQIGLFDTKEEAARAVDEVLKLHFGEFARLNYPEPETPRDLDRKAGTQAA